MEFKVLDLNGVPLHGGSGQWHLPHSGGHPGEWMPIIPTPVVCWRGYQLVKGAYLLEWLGPVIYAAEGRGDCDRGEGKVAYAQARLLYRVEGWTARSARLFAADCAEHVLPLFERRYPDDPRPRRAVRAARDYAKGLIEARELEAAGAAVWANAEDTATTADRDTTASAWDASRAAAWVTARSAEITAAREASLAAAWAAAWVAVEGAERDWQWRRLLEYLQ